MGNSLAQGPGESEVGQKFSSTFYCAQFILVTSGKLLTQNLSDNFVARIAYPPQGMHAVGVDLLLPNS